MLVLAVLAAIGCGGGDDGGGPLVRVHASAALPGADDELRAYRLALEEAGGRAGRFRVELVVDDISKGEPDYNAGLVGSAARRAADDPRVVAHLGEGNSGACAIAMPITNRAGLLHVSSLCSYQGLTQRVGATGDEPRRYRPAGRTTFARLIPNDLVQARAVVEAMRREGIRRPVLIDLRQELYGIGLAAAFRAAAEEAGLRYIDAVPDLFGLETEPAEGTRRILESEGDAIFFAGTVDAAVVAQFHGVAGDRLPWFLGDAAIGRTFTEQIGDAAEIVRVTAPVTDDARATDDVRRRFEARTGWPVSDVRDLYAYETMRAVLAAIETGGDDRAAVLKAFLSRRARGTVIGSYAFDRNGDTTLRRYGLYRIRDRRPVLDAVLTPG